MPVEDVSGREQFGPNPCAKVATRRFVAPELKSAPTEGNVLFGAGLLPAAEPGLGWAQRAEWKQNVVALWKGGEDEIYHKIIRK